MEVGFIYLLFRVCRLVHAVARLLPSYDYKGGILPQQKISDRFEIKNLISELRKTYLTGLKFS
jgi:hypothetical protein